MAKPCAIAPERSAPKAVAAAFWTLEGLAKAAPRTIPPAVTGRIEALATLPPAAGRPVRSRPDLGRREKDKTGSE
jgi:hypothetical protein